MKNTGKTILDHKTDPLFFKGQCEAELLQQRQKQICQAKRRLHQKMQQNLMALKLAFDDIKREIAKKEAELLCLYEQMALKQFSQLNKQLQEIKRLVEWQQLSPNRNELRQENEPQIPLAKIQTALCDIDLCQQTKMITSIQKMELFPIRGWDDRYFQCKKAEIRGVDSWERPCMRRQLRLV